jgi:hypothetical protein
MPAPQYDETLLYQGRYGEWFQTSLTEHARAWVNRKQCPTCGVTPRTNHRCRCQDRTTEPEWVNRESLTWMLKAACRGADLEIFFPDNEAIFNQPDAPWREYCCCCEVTGACILFAVDSKTKSGVYGGKFLRPSHRVPSKNPTGTGKPGRPRKKAVES